jgi:hypothetical protein
MRTKESLLQLIKSRLERYQPEYYQSWLPRLRDFDVIQLVAWVIDHDIADAGTFYN